MFYLFVGFVPTLLRHCECCVVLLIILLLATLPMLDLSTLEFELEMAVIC